MIAALATILFLAVLWTLAVVAVATVERDGGKILSALKGRSLLAAAPVVRPVSWRTGPRARSARPMRARPTLRAAA